MTVADPSTFAGPEPAQLHYLKSQYLASMQMLDQAEAALKAQLDQLAKTRKQVEELSKELDAQLAGGTKPQSPAKPAAKPRRTTSRATVNR